MYCTLINFIDPHIYTNMTPTRECNFIFFLNFNKYIATNNMSEVNFVVSFIITMYLFIICDVYCDIYYILNGNLTLKFYMLGEASLAKGH